MSEQIQGLLTQKSTSPAPVVGEKRRYSWQEKPTKSGSTYIKVKSEGEGFGALYEINKAEKTSFVDKFGNFSYNVVLTPVAGNGTAPSTDPVDYLRNGTPVQPVPSGNDRLSAKQYMANAARLLRFSHKMAEEAMGPEYDHEDARSLFIQAARAGYVETLPEAKPAVAIVEAAPEPEPAAEQSGEEQAFIL